MKTDNVTPRWISISEARKYCPMGERRLIELVQSGEIKGGRLPGDKRRAWFIDRESLDSYLEAQCVPLSALDTLRRIGL
jgi:hypothetical protein